MGQVNYNQGPGESHVITARVSAPKIFKYSKVSLSLNQNVPTDSLGPPLYIVANKDTVVPSDTIIFNVSLGDSETLAEDVYGVNMTLKHKTAEIFGSDNYASFQGSWLGTEDVDMITLGFPLEDGIDIAMTRTDKINRTGKGYLSSVKVIVPDNLGEIAKGLDLRLDDLLIYSYNGDTLFPNIIYGDTIVVYNTEKIGVNTPKNNSLEKGLKVYPNPNSGVFNIDSELKLDKISVMDLSGRLVYKFNMQSQHEVLNISNFEKGVYLIEFQSGNLTTRERVFVK